MIRLPIPRQVKGAAPMVVKRGLKNFFKDFLSGAMARAGGKGWRMNNQGATAAQNKLDQTEEYIQRASYDAAVQTLEQLRDGTPVRTGKTRDGWKLEVVDAMGSQTFIISHDNEKLIDWLNSGTKPHVIRPSKGKALKFKVGDAEIFATKVNHPGFGGTGFVDRARVGLKDMLDGIASARELA